MQSDTLEERYAIKLCFKHGKNATETYGMLSTTFRPSCMNRASVFEWHKRFREGRESVRDDERCWRSSLEAVVLRQLRRWKRLGRRSLTRSPKRTSMRPSRSCWNGTTSAFQPLEITSFHECTINKSAHTKRSGSLSYAFVYIYIYI